MKFVAGTAGILRKKGRLQQFVFLADRSIALVQGNLKLKKMILLEITIGYDFDIERHECTDVLKYYFTVEKMLDNFVDEQKSRIDILLQIGKAYILTAQYRKTLEYTIKAEKIAIEAKDKQGEGSCCLILGIAYTNLGEYEKAITYYHRGLEISSAIGDRSGIANNIRNLGSAYLNLGENENAIMYYLKDLETSSAIGDRLGIARSNGNLGGAYRNLGEYEKAILYYEKGLEINSEIGDQSEIATNNGNLGSTYLYLGEFEKAIMYYQKGLEINSEIGDRSGIARNSSNLGNAYLSLGEYEKAIMYSQKGLEISSANGDRSGIAGCNGYLGNAYLRLGDYEKAIMYYQKGLEISSAIGDQLGVANINGNLGNAYLSLGEYEKAIMYFQKGLEISSSIEDRLGIAVSNGNLGNAFRCLGEYEKAIMYHQKSLQINSTIGRRSGIASNNGNLGNAYLNLGVYEKAIMYYQKSLEISSAIGDRFGIANSNGNLGNAYLSLGEYEKAIIYFEKGLEIGNEIGDRSGIASDIGNLGVAYLRLGEYEKAIMYYLKDLEISSAIGDRSGIARSNGNLGSAYRNLGEYEKAIIYYEKGLEISSAIGNRSGIASMNGNLGNAFLRLGEHEKAIVYHQKGLDIHSEIGDRSGIAIDNGNLGNAYLILGEYEKAIMYYQKGLEINSAIGDRSGIASNNVNLGNAYRNLGEYGKAIEFLTDCLKVSVEIGETSIESVCLGSIGFTYFMEAKSKLDNLEALSIFQEAALYLTRSVNCSDKVFSTLVVDQNKISFAKEYFGWYLILMRCFIFLKRIEAALLVIDLGKAKALHAFREKLKKSKTDTSIDLTWKRIDNNEEKIRTEEIQEALELKFNSSVLLYAFDYDGLLNIWVLNSEDGVKTFRHNELLKELEKSFLKFLLSNVNVNLNRDSSFHKQDLGFTPAGCQTKLAKTPDLSQSETTSSTCFQNLPSVESESSNNTSAGPEDVFRLLYQVLIHPVKEFLKGTKIIIVPDKFLFFVPFCSLLDENGCRLSENDSIQITPSLHTLASSMTRSRDSVLGFALFVGNPTVGKVSFCRQEIQPGMLLSASEEVKYLAPLFEARPLVEGEATKERVLKFIHGASIIHIAAHGEPHRGEIFLAPNANMAEQNSSPPKENSYLLKQRDIMKIGINARLVVLCCCHTGTGKISSEGVVGLARAFLCAGARSVLATLWPIHDEGTKGFMKILYDEICNETSVCEALRKAMNLFQKHENEEFRSFKIWAPFTIYGEDVSFTRDDIEEIKRKSREMNFQV